MDTTPGNGNEGDGAVVSITTGGSMYNFAYSAVAAILPSLYFHS